MTVPSSSWCGISAFHSEIQAYKTVATVDHDVKRSERDTIQNEYKTTTITPTTNFPPFSWAKYGKVRVYIFVFLLLLYHLLKNTTMLYNLAIQLVLQRVLRMSFLSVVELHNSTMKKVLKLLTYMKLRTSNYGRLWTSALPPVSSFTSGSKINCRSE